MADELSASAGVARDQFAMVIGGVFRRPGPRGLLAGQQTVLDALQAGVASQLAVLDDARLTGTGQSSAEVPGGVVAEKLTGHLVREIVLRGARGGPLTPLAGQLNFDLLLQQGQRLEGALAG